MNHFTEALGLSRYTLYMRDYGGPVGFRMALAHPDRTEALIVQDALAHNEGLAATRTRHVGNDPNVERYDPDLWTWMRAISRSIPQRMRLHGWSAAS